MVAVRESNPVDLRAAIARIRILRTLHNDLYEAEQALAVTYNDFDHRRAQERLMEIRRRLVRLRPDVQPDLERCGVGLLGLRDAPVWGGRIHVVHLVDALVSGAAASYNVTPMSTDTNYETAIAWHERELASSIDRDRALAEAQAQKRAAEQVREQKRAAERAAKAQRQADSEARRHDRGAARAAFIDRYAISRWLNSIPRGLALVNGVIGFFAWCWRLWSVIPK